MTRQERFTFRINNSERQMISILADRLQRSQSDAVRFVVVNAAQELEKLDRINDSNLNIKRVKDDSKE